MKKVKKEDGAFGDGGGTVFTSSNSGVFTPTYGAGPKQKKQRKRTGVNRLADFLRDHSPEKKMVKATRKSVVELVKWVTTELHKEQDSQFTQQNSGTSINDQPPRIDWKKKKEESPEDTNAEPSEFDAEPDKQAAVKQNDETKRIKQLDDSQDDKRNDPHDTGQASTAAPAGLNIKLDTESDEIDPEENIEIPEDKNYKDIEQEIEQALEQEIKQELEKSSS
jgi:hypothetical protein